MNKARYIFAASAEFPCTKFVSRVSRLTKLSDSSRPDRSIQVQIIDFRLKPT